MMSSLNNMQRGMSVVEMLVSVAIFAIIMSAIVGFVQYFYRSNTVALEQAFAIESARKGVEFLVRDVREMAYAETGAYPIVSFATSSITFYADTDRDATVERIRYYLSGTTFYRAALEPTGVPLAYTGVEEVSAISDNVRNNEQGTAIFTYENVSGGTVTALSDIADIVFVSVDLVVNIRPLSAPNEFTLRSSATIRNLRPQ
jgi:prepilin-type N-terminal cleavage/methylation domain-containing protein